MVGIFERAGVYYTLLKDSSGKLHRATVGNYLGKNAGRIEHITENDTKIKEWVPDGKGGWQEHVVIMPLYKAKP